MEDDEDLKLSNSQYQIIKATADFRRLLNQLDKGPDVASVMVLSTAVDRL